MAERKGKVAFKTLGCKVNQYDTASLMNLFQKEGYQLVSRDSQADILVINTCIVTKMAAQKSRKLIRQLRRSNPKALIVVTGCYPQVHKEEIATMPEVDLFVGTKDRGLVLQYIRQGLKGDRVSNYSLEEVFEDHPICSFPGHTRAFIKIQEGCLNGCTYCIIPRARGPLRHRELVSILREAEDLLNKGYKELVFTGIHLGSYGEGGHLSLLSVVKEVLKLKGSFRLRLSSLEITEVEEGLIELLSLENNLACHLHLPLQSGSFWVLKRMGRPYTPKEYQKKALLFQERIPSLSITTDIMVGFPGEKEEDFQASYRLAQEVGFSNIHSFIFSPRPKTLAYQMKHQIPTPVKKKRLQSLESLAWRLKREYESSFLGQEREVLIEESKAGILSGLTDNYIRVSFSGSEELRGSLQKVYLHSLTDDGIWGTIDRRGCDNEG